MSSLPYALVILNCPLVILNLFQDLPTNMSNTSYYVYILTNFTNTTLYIGVTNNIERRIQEHKQGVVDGFSKKYHLDKLVYLEEYSNINDAIKREKQLKNWHRDWKINLIKAKNPKLFDLSI